MAPLIVGGDLRGSLRCVYGAFPVYPTALQHYGGSYRRGAERESPSGAFAVHEDRAAERLQVH